MSDVCVMSRVHMRFKVHRKYDSTEVHMSDSCESCLTCASCRGESCLTCESCRGYESSWHRCEPCLTCESCLQSKRALRCGGVWRSESCRTCMLAAYAPCRTRASCLLYESCLTCKSYRTCESCRLYESCVTCESCLTCVLAEHSRIRSTHL